MNGRLGFVLMRLSIALVKNQRFSQKLTWWLVVRFPSPLVRSRELGNLTWWETTYPENVVWSSCPQYTQARLWWRPAWREDGGKVRITFREELLMIWKSFWWFGKALAFWECIVVTKLPALGERGKSQRTFSEFSNTTFQHYNVRVQQMQYGSSNFYQLPQRPMLVLCLFC